MSDLQQSLENVSSVPFGIKRQIAYLEHLIQFGNIEVSNGARFSLRVLEGVKK